MAQWIVFLNGLILTFSAYFALGYFVNQSISQEEKRLSYIIEKSIDQQVASFQSSMRAAATMVSGMPDLDGKILQSRMKYAIPDIDMFSSIVWIRKVQGGGWTVTPLYAGEKYPPPAGPSAGWDGALVNALAAAAASGEKDMIVYTDESAPQYGQEDDDPQVSARLFFMVRPLRDANGAVESLIAGRARASAILSREWIMQRAPVIRMAIRDQDTGQPYFSLAGVADSGGAPERSFVVRMGDRGWKVFYSVSGGTGAAILKRLPLLLLLFGGCMTLMGTLYVRTNQFQSSRLSTLNKILAKKNYELNSEVSERARLNEVLHNAEREYRALVDSVSDAIFETTPEGDIIFLNAAWERLTGFDIPQCLNRSLFEFMHQQEREEQRQNFRDVVRGKRGAVRTYTRLRTRDGVFRSVEMSVSLIRLDDRRIARVVGSFADVQERHRAERALNEVEKKYRAIVENAAGGIYQMTPEGNILSANPAMARILGFASPESMLQDMRNALDYMFTSSRDRAHFLKEVSARNTVLNMEVQGKTLGGGQIWLNVNAHAVRDADGTILYYEGSLENISHRKQAETMLREAKIRSDLASRAKSEFLANMSHELRTPLNAIIGFSEIIRNEVLGPVGNRQYWEYSDDIYQSGRKLLGIINEILDISRIEAGDRQLNEGRVDVPRLVAECVEFMSLRIREGGLSCANLVEGDVPHILGEDLAIKQILLNLLSNAVKFTPQGGRIALTCEVDFNGQFLLSVTDTGIGLDEKEIEKALSPFGQVDSSLNRSGSGAGLGLTLVDSLIKLHGGRLELFSQKGIGTTATVVFPAERVLKDRQDAKAGKGSGAAESPRV